MKPLALLALLSFTLGCAPPDPTARKGFSINESTLSTSSVMYYQDCTVPDVCFAKAGWAGRGWAFYVPCDKVRGALQNQCPKPSTPSAECPQVVRPDEPDQGFAVPVTP